MASRSRRGSRSEKRSRAGGYNNEFVHSPPDSLCCGVCTLPYRDPHLLGCCGKKICESCIDYVRKSSKPCPYCNQTISSVLDKELRSKVLDMAVYCSYKSRGCEWTGEMRRLQRHVREDCKYSRFQLRLNMACSVKALRSPLCRSAGHGNCSIDARLFFTIRLNRFRVSQSHTKGYAVLSRNTPCSNAIEIVCTLETLVVIVVVSTFRPHTKTKELSMKLRIALNDP